MGCAPPLWPSLERLEITSFISVFPTPGPGSGLYGRHSKYAEMNEFSLDREEEACYWKHEGSQVVLRSHQDFKGQGLNCKTCLQTGKIMAYTYQTFSGKLLLGSKNTQISKLKKKIRPSCWLKKVIYRETIPREPTSTAKLITEEGDGVWRMVPKESN